MLMLNVRHRHSRFDSPPFSQIRLVQLYPGLHRGKVQYVLVEGIGMCRADVPVSYFHSIDRKYTGITEFPIGVKSYVLLLELTSAGLTYLPW